MTCSRCTGREEDQSGELSAISIYILRILPVGEIEHSDPDQLVMDYTKRDIMDEP